MAQEWVKLTVRVKPEVHAALKIICKKDHTLVIRALINRYVKMKSAELAKDLVHLPPEDFTID